MTRSEYFGDATLLCGSISVISAAIFYFVLTCVINPLGPYNEYLEFLFSIGYLGILILGVVGFAIMELGSAFIIAEYLDDVLGW